MKLDYFSVDLMHCSELGTLQYYFGNLFEEVDEPTIVDTEDLDETKLEDLEDEQLQ